MKTTACLKSVLMILIIITFSSCSKKDSAVQKFYKCNCSGKTLDWEFGGYDTYSNDTTSGVMATSYQDAMKKCNEKDFHSGEEYQDCTAMP
jgi:hypothetical protein